MMKTMQPILTTQLENNGDYLYEVKYDGFRAILHWTAANITIKSRKNVDLTMKFPEIIQACKETEKAIKHLLPLQMDGELVIFNHHEQGNFALIQKRGRLENKEKIMAASQLRPARYVVFDLLIFKGESYKDEKLIQRKKQLEAIFSLIQTSLIQLVPVYTTYESVKRIVFEQKAEGTVAKHKNSRYHPGKQHRDWLKEKNWRTVYGILTAYNEENGYYQISVYDDGDLISIGPCSHGLTEIEKITLRKVFLQKGKRNHSIYTIPPAFGAQIHTLDLLDGQIREPEFVKLLPQLDVDICTNEKLQFDLAMLPTTISISNEEKVFWPKKQITKGQLLIYMREMYPLMKPYINQKPLTVIRCPDGISETCFFQKHLPTYAPDFFMKSAEQRIVCNQLDSLIWLANHGAIEYHTPFATIDSSFPDEIVFDLDPPSRKAFPLAVEVAQLFKKVLSELAIQSFIKTSGNKGLQIHIPIHAGQFSYEETGNFTKNLAKIIEQAAPKLCTTERFKNKRSGRLYIDYVQHGKNKTIIAPYSPRKGTNATIATPLFWEEVTAELIPEQFTILHMMERIHQKGCPWLHHYETARKQSLAKALPLFHG